MIVVKIELFEATTDHETDRGTMVIDNIGGDHQTDDYRCRMYKKGEIKRVGAGWKLTTNSKPTREGRILGHKRLKEPVQNLVAKALKEMGYG